MSPKPGDKPRKSRDTKSRGMTREAVAKLPLRDQRTFWVEEFKRTEIAQEFIRTNRQFLNDMKTYSSAQKKQSMAPMRDYTILYLEDLIKFARSKGASTEVLQLFERSIWDLSGG